MIYQNRPYIPAKNLSKISIFSFAYLLKQTIFKLSEIHQKLTEKQGGVPFLKNLIKLYLFVLKKTKCSYLKQQRTSLLVSTRLDTTDIRHSKTELSQGQRERKSHSKLHTLITINLSVRRFDELPVKLGNEV